MDLVLACEKKYSRTFTLGDKVLRGTATLSNGIPIERSGENLGGLIVHSFSFLFCFLCLVFRCCSFLFYFVGFGDKAHDAVTILGSFFFFVGFGFSWCFLVLGFGFPVCGEECYATVKLMVSWLSSCLLYLSVLGFHGCFLYWGLSSQFAGGGVLHYSTQLKYRIETASHLLSKRSILDGGVVRRLMNGRQLP